MPFVYRMPRERKDQSTAFHIAGSAAVSRFIVLILLAVAVFFYVRAVLPPADRAATEQARVPSQDGDAKEWITTEGNPRSPSAGSHRTANDVTAVYAPSGAKPAPNSPGLDSKLIGALAGKALGPAPEKASSAPKVGAAAMGGMDEPVVNGRLAVPENQLDLIKRVFAPELLSPTGQ